MKQPEMKILVVDDQRAVRRIIVQLLESLTDVVVTEADSSLAALAEIERSAPDLVLLDIRLTPNTPDRGGLDVLRVVRAKHPMLDVVMVTAASEIGDVRAAMRLGATDYVLKDELSAELLLPIVEAVRERIDLRGEVSRLRARVDRTQGLGAIVGASAGMEEVRALVRRVANADATVLIRGETGTGKELVARAIHELSARRDQPFIAINCSALPHALMESLIFGHERGAFTGAAARAKGQLELAGKGTILLDELAEMPLDLQAKLLRVIEDRAFRPLGAAREVPLAARLLVATHADLEQRMQEGRFRQDLFFRVNVVSITLPSLSQRVEDIPDLVQALSSSLPRKLRFDGAAMEWLVLRRWPGNVRELRNIIERVSILAEEDLVTREVLERFASNRSGVGLQVEIDRIVTLLLSMPTGSGTKLDPVERTMMIHAMRLNDGNVFAAARLLGFDRKTFERHWRRFSQDGGEPEKSEDEGG